jgi:hypothetical protein
VVSVSQEAEAITVHAMAKISHNDSVNIMPSRWDKQFGFSVPSIPEVLPGDKKRYVSRFSTNDPASWILGHILN